MPQKMKDMVHLSCAEYARTLRLMGAYQTLEDEAERVLSKYDTLINTAGLRGALDRLGKIRLEVHDDIGRRYGWDDQ